MTAKAHEGGEEEQTFLPKGSSSDDVSAEFGPEVRGHVVKKRRGIVWWLRLLLDLAMAGTIVYLVVAKPFVVSRETIRRTPVPQYSRGYVVIEHAERYDLPKPYTVPLDRHNDGPGYMMTVFHQLHCLSYLAEHWQRGYAGANLTEEVAHHTAHCFNYLRQGIMCAADTTLEGETDAGPGEGSEHECKNYDEVLKWANEHAAMRWRNGLLPGTSIL
ncbi:hypothetical protein VTH82DRAFT_607 [Thermothelomyces myriococcoides]